MKQLFILLNIAIAASVQAQNVEFTDSKFKDYLLNHAQVQGFENGTYPVIQLDADSNDVISIDEAKKVYRLTCRGDIDGLNFNDKIRFLDGIEFFENLEFLDVSAQNISHVNLDKNDKLKTFVSIPGDLVTATFTGLDSLQVIDIDQNRLYSILLKQLPNLRSVSVLDNTLIEVDASECDSIVDIQVKGNLIQNLCVPTHAHSYVTVDTAIFVDTLCGINVPENNIVFSDSVFERFLVKYASFSTVVGNKGVPVNIDPDGDGKISYDDAKKVQNIFCSGYQLNIDTINDWFTDMTGIEAFTDLRRLEVFNQNLKKVDVSKNKKLTLFTIMRTPIETVQLDNLPLLEALSLGSNRLSSIKLSNLPKLIVLSVFENELKDLNLSELPTLQHVAAEKNNISKICLPKSIYDSVQVTKDSTTVLDTLCGVNAIYLSDQNLLNAVLAYQPPIDTNGDSIITYEEAYAVDSINLSFQNILLFTGLEAFKNLKKINVSNNLLTNLDVSQLVYLTQLIASNNQLKSLITFTNSSAGQRRTGDENNVLIDLDLSNNNFENLDLSIYSSLNSFDGSGNRQLSEICLTTNQLENKVSTWSKDVTTTWSTSNCARVTKVVGVQSTNSSLYPNPANTVVWTEKEVSKVYSLLGKEQTIKWLSGTSMDVSSFDNGVYYFQFLDGSTSKLVVNKR